MAINDKLKEEAELGKRIVLENKEFADISRNTKGMLELYFIDLSENALGIFAEFYRSYNEIDNPAPRRVRIEQAVLKFEDLIYGRERKERAGILI